MTKQEKLRALCARHEWTCHICDGSIPREYELNDPDAPSRDHRVPGRPGIAFNVRPAHRWCNSQRGRRKLRRVDPDAMRASLQLAVYQQTSR